jgi:cytoskeleton protein RodZ
MDDSMNEGAGMSSNLSEAEPLLAATTPQSAGALLRQLRTQQGLHIGALAAMLKVPQAKLEALEADRWKDLPDATFARALAKAMCRVLKADAQAVLALLPRGNEPELMVSRGLNQPYREHDGRSEGLSRAVFQRPLVVGALLLLAAAAAIYLMPAGWVDRLGQSEVKVAELVASAPQANPVVEEAALIEPAASALLLQAEPAPIASAPLAVVVPAATVPAGAVPLSIKITAESWVEVVDARGQVLLSKTLRAGEDQALTGLPPLKVKVGNVAGTEMHLRGSKVDLAGQALNNVARLELN